MNEFHNNIQIVMYIVIEQYHTSIVLHITQNLVHLIHSKTMFFGSPYDGYLDI